MQKSQIKKAKDKEKSREVTDKRSKYFAEICKIINKNNGRATNFNKMEKDIININLNKIKIIEEYQKL